MSQDSTSDSIIYTVPDFTAPFIVEDHINNNPWNQRRYWIVDYTGRYVESWDSYPYAIAQARCRNLEDEVSQLRRRLEQYEGKI